MNIYRLNQKLRHIMEVFDIIQRDQLQTLSGCYLGIHQDYLFHQVIKFPSLFDINYDELKLNMANFFQMIKEHNITPIVIMSSQTHQRINPKLIIKCQFEKNKAQFRELIYNDAVMDTEETSSLIQILTQTKSFYLFFPKNVPRLWQIKSTTSF